MGMTSRERIRKMLTGQPIDRLPNGLGGTINTGMHLLAYRTLRTMLGLPEIPIRMMSFEANALFDLDVLDSIEADLVPLGVKITPARFWGEEVEQDWKPETLWDTRVSIPRQWSLSVDSKGRTWIDGFCWDPFHFNIPLERAGCRLLCPSGGRYFDPVFLPGDISLRSFSITDYHPPTAFPDEWLRGIERSAEWLFRNTDFSIVCDEMVNDLQLTPGGMASWWMTLVTEPNLAHDFLAKACEAGIAQLRLLDQAVGKYADILMIAQDFGDLRGVSIGPDLWREIYFPHYRRLFGEWKTITSMKIGMHSCGAISDILGDLAECGLDVINPVQVSARGMEPESLQERFGQDLIFYGGSYDAVSLPVDLPEEEIYLKVKRNIESLSQGRGYIFSGVHNIQGNVPAAHLEAMLAAFQDVRDNKSS